MASSNVQYYEKQKELQDKMTSCEQQRLQLERELRLAHQADHTSSQMKASRLQTYWKKICDDEKRAKQRNEMLIREFERIDAHMAEMNARTQRLALMKRQYADYIERTYPEWNALMHGSAQHSEVKSQIEKPARSKDKIQQPKSPSSRVSSPSLPAQELEQVSSPRGEVLSPRQELQIHQSLPSSQTKQSKPVSDTETELFYSTPQTDINHQSPEDQTYKEQQEDIMRLSNSSIGDYANLPSARQKEEAHTEGLNESSIDQEEEISHPIRSVEIQSKTSGRLVQSSQYTMEPPEEDDDGEETSEFGTDNEIPMAQSLGNTAVLAPSASKSSSSSIKPELSIDGLIRLLNLVENDFAEAFSLEGYYRSSWPDTAKKNDIIRSSNMGDSLSHVDANLVSMVILEQITLIVRSLPEKCVLPESLLQGDTRSLTAAQLRQLLSPEAQLIWDSLFHHFQQLVSHRALEPPELSAIFTPSLVGEGGSQDKGHGFMVRLLEEWSANNVEVPMRESINTISPAQTMEGSASFMEDGVPPLKFGSLLEKHLSDDESSYVKSLPRDPTPLNETDAYKNMLSGTAALRRQPSSGPDDTDDDVEKQIATVLTQKPKPISPKPNELDEPSDVSSMTQTTSHVYVPTAMDTKSPRSPIKPMGSNLSSGRSAPLKYQGVKISSDLDTDTEVDVGVFGSSKKQEDDFDFYD